jgi:hypothetical protein
LSSFLLSISNADSIKVTVTVVDEEGRPLKNANVSVIRPRPAAELLWAGRTDSEGRFSLVLEEGTQVMIIVSWKGLDVAEFSGPVRSENLTIVASVRDLKVIVLDHRGRSVSDCEVSLTWIMSSKNETEVQFTGNDGVATFSQVPESVHIPYAFEVAVRKFGFLLGKISLPSLSLEGWNLTLNFELYDLRLRVLDRAFSPVAGAMIEVSAGSQKVIARSDEEGFADIVQLPPSLYKVKATFKSYGQDAQVLVENDSSTVITLPFIKSYNVTLLFRWDDGRPGLGLSALLKGGGSKDIKLTTDASGTSSLSLYPGVYNVSVSKGSINLGTFNLEVRADTKKEFILNSSLRLNELTVRLRSSEGRVIDGTVVVSREGVEVGKASTSGGSAKLFLSDGLYRVVAQAQGYDVSEAEISLNSDQELELRLSPTPSPLSSPIVSIAIVACVALVTFAVARSLFSKRRE